MAAGVPKSCLREVASLPGLGVTAHGSLPLDLGYVPALPWPSLHAMFISTSSHNPGTKLQEELPWYFRRNTDQFKKSTLPGSRER